MLVYFRGIFAAIGIVMLAAGIPSAAASVVISSPETQAIGFPSVGDVVASVVDSPIPDDAVPADAAAPSDPTDFEQVLDDVQHEMPDNSGLIPDGFVDQALAFSALSSPFTTISPQADVVRVFDGGRAEISDSLVPLPKISLAWGLLLAVTLYQLGAWTLGLKRRMFF